eukprot:659775-Rhodomonas_salina.1
MAADVVLNEPIKSHRGLKVLGLFQSLSEGNSAATRYCTSMQTQHVKAFPNTVPNLNSKDKEGLVNFELQFHIASGNLQSSQHIWVQRFKLDGETESFPKHFFFVTRSLFKGDDAMSDDDEMDEDNDEEDNDDAIFYEEVVAVTTSAEEASRVAGTCCSMSALRDSETGMMIEDDGTWMATVKNVTVLC